MSHDQGRANAPYSAEPFQDSRNCANEVVYARIDESHGRGPTLPYDSINSFRRRTTYFAAPHRQRCEGSNCGGRFRYEEVLMSWPARVVET